MDDEHEAVDVLSVTSDQVHSKEEDKEDEASSIVNPLMTVSWFDFEAVAGETHLAT